MKSSSNSSVIHNQQDAQIINPSQKLMTIRWLCRIGTAFSFIVILVGAATRLTDSGLGCPDWPGCYGQIWIPAPEEALAVAPDVPLEAFKAGMEMFHRYLATSLGLLVLMVAALSWKLRFFERKVFQLSALLLGAVILQGAFGAWTVTWKLLPQIVTMHLLGGLTCMSLFAITALTCSQRIKVNSIISRSSNLGIEQSPTQKHSHRLHWYGCSVLLILILQIGLGGWTSANYAAVGCVGFPTCNNQWIPPMDFQSGFDITSPIGPDYLHGQLSLAARTAIHITHRLVAVVLGIALLLYWFNYQKLLAEERQRKYQPKSDRTLLRSQWQSFLSNPVSLCLALYACQIAIGIYLVSFDFPLVVAVMHTAGAVLLLLALIRCLSSHSKQPANIFKHPKSTHCDHKYQLQI